MHSKDQLLGICHDSLIMASISQKDPTTTPEISNNRAQEHCNSQQTIEISDPELNKPPWHRSLTVER